jgi:hypothetical protein
VVVEVCASCIPFKNYGLMAFVNIDSASEMEKEENFIQ